MLFAFCGYDAAGNLFVDGQYGEHSTDFAFAELPKGGNSLVPVALKHRFQHAGAVQWDGQYVAVGDDVAQEIYRFAIKRSRAILKGTTSLRNNSYGYQWWIDRKRVVSTNTFFNGSGAHFNVLYYNYPLGGNATKTITKGVHAPFGITISKASSLNRL
jgi:hypothetical protein